MIHKNNAQGNITIVKKDGNTESFNINKLAKSLLNSNIDYNDVDLVVNIVCNKIYNNIHTEQIKKIVCNILKEIDNEKGTKYAENYQFKNILKVRTSKKEFEAFDINKIIDALTNETGIDKETAQKIGNDIEKEVKKFNLNYLTAPMIRELVNAKLIEYGLEEYRQKHTRLGIPVYDIKKLIDKGSRENANLMHNPESIHKWIADETMKQYALLEVFPKHIADAHMSGDIHLHDLEYAAIRPVCCQHDLRGFFLNGLKVDGTGNHTSVSKPAKHAEVAIQHAAKVLSAAQCEMSGGQSIDEFNIWLAPYMKGLSYDRVKQLMQMFIYEMNQMYVARGGQSLVNDELIFVKDNEGLRIYKIGELVDEFMEKYNDNIIIKGDTELIYLDEKEELYTTSVNVNTGKAEFKRVYALSRHKPHNKIYKVVGKDGTTVSITEDHSLYHYNENNELVAVKPLELNHLIKIENIEDSINNSKITKLEIKEINEIDYEGYVYDLSVKDNENFITATGILCHNTVFSSMNLEIEVPKYLKDKPAAIAGTTRGTYGEYEEETKMILEALIDVVMEGDAVGKPFLFPNFIVKLRENAFKDENKHLMIKLHELSSKWGLPYFINMNPEWQANNTNAMGCRTRLSGDWTGDTENDTLRTGNMQWYTLNLPRIAYEAGGNDDKLFEILSEKMGVIKEAISIKHDITQKILNDRIMPFMTQRFKGGEKEEQYYRYDNTTKTFGFVGLNELLQFHIGEELHQSKEAVEFGRKVIEFMRNYANDLKKETGLRWTLTQTPAESSLPYDEKILIVRDGKYELVKIGEFVESSFKKYESGILEYGENNSEVFIKYDNIYAPSFDKNDNIVLKPITHAIRHKGKEIYEIETTKNKKVKITGDHSVFALDNDLSVVEVKASNLKEGDFIITPKKIPSIERKNIYLSDIIKNKENYYGKINNHKKYLKENETSIKEEYASYKTPYKDLKSIMRRKNIFRLKALKSVKSEDIKGISYRSSKYIPNKINLNYDFGYLIGAFLSEGHWNEKNVEISNTDKGFIEELCNIINEVFGKNSYYVSLKDDKRGYKPLYVIGLCKTVSMVFKEFGLNELSKGKKIPSIMLSNEEFLMGLIKGYIVGDGNIYINNDKSDYSIRLYTTSEGLKETLGMALKILGIDFKVSVDRKSDVNEKWNDCYVIKITGAENLNKLLCTNIKNNGGKDIIPKLPVQFKKIIDTHTQKEWMEKYDINIRSLHIWEDIKKGYISRNRAEKLFNIFNSIDEIKNNHKLLMNTIKNVIYGDLQFEKIKSIKKLDAPNYVYDISVEDTENFIGGENGFVCLHNTAGRFARLDHQHYKKETESVVKGDLSNIGSAYYTNSSHPRVDEGITLGEKVAIDEVFHPLCNGGHMGHFWNAEAYADPEGLMEITRKISTRDVGFWTYTKNLSICEKCSVAMGGLKDNCNNCGSSEIQKYSRITGYLQNISNWNDAKRRELADRKSNIKKI